MFSTAEIKQQVGAQAAQLVQPNMIVGIGTGSTVYWFITALAKRIQHGLVCSCVPTSLATKSLAAELGISLVELNDVTTIDIDIDGADEIDPQLHLIKGGGGALLQEKMVAAASAQVVIIADSGKLVKQLGAFPLPVEVIPYGWKQVQQHIQIKNNIQTELRLKNKQPFVTDHGHYILDCYYEKIEDPNKLSVDLNMIPGVVANGLFIKMANSAIIGFPDGRIETMMHL